MADKQTTAVEWLAEQIVKFHEWKLNPTFDENCFDEIELNKAIKQALAMERNQTKQAYEAGQDDGYQYHVNGLPRYDSETWYDNTYGKE